MMNSLRGQKITKDCLLSAILNLWVLPQIQKLLKEENVPDNKIREFIELPVADAYQLLMLKLTIAF